MFTPGQYSGRRLQGHWAKGRGFDPHYSGRCVVYLSKIHLPPKKVLVIPRKRWLRPDKNCWLGCKTSTQTNKSKSYLQVTMTYMRTWMSLKFGQIRLLVSMSTNSVIIDKKVLPLFLGCFYPILFILADNDEMHVSSEDFEIQPDAITDCGVSCPLASKKIPIGLYIVMEKTVLPLFLSYILGQIFFILAGNDDIHKRLDEFEIRPDPIRDHRSTCMLLYKWNIAKKTTVHLPSIARSHSSQNLF